MPSETRRSKFPKMLPATAVSDAMHDAVFSIAKESGVSLAEVIRNAIDEYLEMLADMDTYTLEAAPRSEANAS